MDALDLTVVSKAPVSLCYFELSAIYKSPVLQQVFAILPHQGFQSAGGGASVVLL